MGLPLMMSMTICNFGCVAVFALRSKIKPNEYFGVIGRNILDLLVCIHQ